ncbi:MAG: alpha/beta fold hydrolase [Dehalococcoidia bacterium]
MPMVDRDGVKIHYEVAGSGPAVLITHGYSSSAKAWEGQVAALQDRYKVITWDMRGHAGSDSPDDPARYSEAHTVEDIAAVLRACGESRAVISGLSLGGYMTLAFHLAHPEMTRAIMLFDCGPGYKNPQARDGWNQTSEQRAVNFETKGLTAMGSSPEVKISVHRSAQGLANAARGMLKQFDARAIESLEHIHVPALVLVGENDTPFLNASDYMAKKIPGAVFVKVPDAGHAANIDNPDYFNRAVAEFLASLPAV